MILIYTLIGFLLFGPVGGVIAFLSAAYLYNQKRQKKQNKKGEEALVKLAASVITADGFVDKAEVLFAKEFFIASFGKSKAKSMMYQLKNYVDRRVDVASACQEINSSYSIYQKHTILRFLSKLAQADKSISLAESEAITYIASLLGFVRYSNSSDSRGYSDSRSYGGYGNYYDEPYENLDEYYKILGLDKNVSDDELKKAYKALALKYHPDRVAGKGEEAVKEANEKFTKINQAYEKIKESRGIL